MTVKKRAEEQSPASTSATSNANAYRIGGISIEFPYKAYGSQLAFMGKVVATLERSFSGSTNNNRNSSRGQHCHALLESPTGTGKSLALLCSTLAWQKHFKAISSSSSTSITPAIPLSSDALLASSVLAAPHLNPDAGGGFIADDTATEICPQFARDCSADGGKTSSRRRKVPTIFYATRTHSQISQVIREYKKTSYRVHMAVLAARKHYCNNKTVCKKKNIDEECKLLLKDPDRACLYFKNMHKVKNHTSLQKGGPHEVHDIEDLVGIGNSVRGCAYFAARSMALDAEIVFCPYSYLLNPVIRSAMEINLAGTVVILDEAHNIEDVAREAGSIDLEIKTLEAMRVELQQLAGGAALAVADSTGDIYHPLLDMVQEILIWIHEKSSLLEKQDFERYSSSWSGENLLRELESAGISSQNFSILFECAKKAIGAASDAESNSSHLSGFSAAMLEGLFSVLSFMLKENKKNLQDYRLVIQKYVKRDEEIGVSGWVSQLSFWCLNPAVVFEEVAANAQSIILTSGTLSPTGSFASELGVPFEVCMEAPHVIDMKKQVWAASISRGPGGIPLNASYKHADGYAFQDSLGSALEEVFKVSPDGALVFFPSYKLLEKLCDRWKCTGQWKRLSEQKQLFTEPRGKFETFGKLLDGYYQAISGKMKRLDPKVRSNGRKRNAKDQQVRNLQSGELEPKSGAAFLAVCRGKVSEGLDFSDKNARLVIVVGIPFPNQKDLQVNMKKKYNSQYSCSKNLLSGDQWYCYQAFRALNQAVGRCIRHRYDYGAIMLMDERYKKAGQLEYMSKWLRNSIQQVENFEHSLTGLQTFYRTFESSIVDADSKKILEHMDSSGDAPKAQFSFSKPRSVNNIELNGWLGTGKVESKRRLDGKDCQSSRTNRRSEDCSVPVDFKYLTTVERSPLQEIVSQTNSDIKSAPRNYGSSATLLETPEIATARSSSTKVTASGIENFPSRNSFLKSEKTLVGASIASNKTKLYCGPDKTPVLDSYICSTGTETCYTALKPFEVEHFTAKDAQQSEAASSLDDLPIRRLLSDFVACTNSRTAEGDYNSVTNGGQDQIAAGSKLRLSCSKCGNSILSVMGQQESSDMLLLPSKKKFVQELFDYFYQGPLLNNTAAVMVTKRIELPTGSRDGVTVNNYNQASQGVWVKEDGCVFCPLFCPWCRSKHCIGAQILAANCSNMGLLDKALLFTASVTVVDEAAGYQKETGVQESRDCKNDGRWIGSHSQQCFESEAQAPFRCKLKLPRRE